MINVAKKISAGEKVLGLTVYKDGDSFLKTLGRKKTV